MNKDMFKLTLSVFSLCSALNAQAALVNITDHGDYFSDTVSNLDWLDVTATLNLSYDDVSSQFGTGGDYEGWRYATASEFGQMLNNITGFDSKITGVAQIGESVPEGLFDEFLPIIGNSYYEGTLSAGNTPLDPEVFAWSRGFIADTYDNPLQPGVPHHYLATIFDMDISISPNDYAETNYTERDDFSDPTFGSFLVRNTTAVPTPPAFTLLGIGLLGFLTVRRMRV